MTDAARERPGSLTLWSCNIATGATRQRKKSAGIAEWSAENTNAGAHQEQANKLTCGEKAEVG